jgi:8-oxo-dGTP pyrophosphatase MutT (NUDIX family)
MTRHVACRSIVGKATRMQSGQPGTAFMRHVQACNNADLPGRRLPFRISGKIVGWVLPDFRDALARFPEITAADDGVTLTAPAALQAIARSLSEEGLHRWRGEAFDVRAEPGGPVLAVLDRGSLPAFGVRSVGVHVNGLVRRPEGLHVWVGRRAAHKQLDPNKLDHVVAGGVPAGMTEQETLVKEAGEEASILPSLACRAVPVGWVGYAMERREGLRRDLLHCYDLDLPEDFRPVPQDDEVAEFELWPIDKVFEAVRDTDAFKFNVNLVLIDLFLRLRLIAAEEARGLRAGLDQPAGRGTGGGPAPL